jgi:hypothetical protein
MTPRERAFESAVGFLAIVLAIVVAYVVSK